MDEQPVWRRLFDAWEKEFGPRLEEYVQSDEFAERIAGIQQMTRRQAEIAEEATRQFLRFWNLPTASDLDKVNQQLAEIDRRLRALHRPVAQEAPAPGPRKRQGSKTAAGMKAAVESREAAAKTNEVVVEAAELAGAAVGDTTAPVTSADTAGSAEGATAKASVSKAKASKAKTTKAKASTGNVRKATPAKASRSSKSSAPAQKASQKAESRSPGSGYRDEGQNPKGEA